ncbi:hypothetical protein [Nitrosomonas sp. Nm34]|uniref:hypothetical protein n=1 Tax=Nitrosomonas sp. Nm34 TaxID=1881055 RepID=UPI0008E6E4A8|nr:hypothetical protein [Nitrosomonas sp. Nm34]SFI31677.1 hypothetical protein SAMN05428978_100586 [Nitrosomonas sp. Nm34]
MLTEYGRLIRESRLEIGETLMSMATHMKENLSYLSGIETGRIAADDLVITKTHKFFLLRGLNLDIDLMLRLAKKKNDTFKDSLLFKR